MEKLKPEKIFTEEVVELIEGIDRGWILVDKETKAILSPKDGTEGVVVSGSKIESILINQVFGIEEGGKIESAHYRYWIKLTKALFKNFSKSMITKINKEERFVNRGSREG